MEIESISICVPSETTKGTQYTVLANTHRVTCTCPDYIFRKAESGKSCKHIDYCIKKQKFTINGIS